MYALVHENKAFGPDGLIQGVESKDAAEYNKAVEASEIEALKAHPDKVFLYVKEYVSASKSEPIRYAVTTWLGTVVSADVQMGNRSRCGFGFNTYRRAMSAWIFGTLYHGWYMESS